MKKTSIGKYTIKHSDPAPQLIHGYDEAGNIEWSDYLYDARYIIPMPTDSGNLTTKWHCGGLLVPSWEELSITRSEWTRAVVKPLAARLPDMFSGTAVFKFHKGVIDSVKTA